MSEKVLSLEELRERVSNFYNPKSAENTKALQEAALVKLHRKLSKIENMQLELQNKALNMYDKWLALQNKDTKIRNKIRILEDGMETITPGSPADSDVACCGSITIMQAEQIHQRNLDKREILELVAGNDLPSRRQILKGYIEQIGYQSYSCYKLLNMVVDEFAHNLPLFPGLYSIHLSIEDGVDTVVFRNNNGKLLYQEKDGNGLLTTIDPNVYKMLGTYQDLVRVSYVYKGPEIKIDDLLVVSDVPDDDLKFDECCGFDEHTLLNLYLALQHVNDEFPEVCGIRISTYGYLFVGQTGDAIGVHITDVVVKALIDKAVDEVRSEVNSIVTFKFPYTPVSSRFG